MNVSPIPVNPFPQNFNDLTLLEISNGSLFYFALVWQCDNTPVKSSDIFISNLDYVNLVLKPFYEPKGIRVICIDSIETEVTNI